MAATIPIGQTRQRQPTIPMPMLREKRTSKHPNDRTYTVSSLTLKAHAEAQNKCTKLFEAIVSESVCLWLAGALFSHFYIYIEYLLCIPSGCAWISSFPIVAHLRSNKLVYGVFLFLSRCRKFGAPELRCRRAKIGVILEIHWHLCRYCGNSVDILSSFCRSSKPLPSLFAWYLIRTFCKNVCAKPSRTNKQTNRPKKKAITTGVAFARWRTICCWNERTYSIGFCSTLYWCDSGLIITIKPVKRKWKEGGPERERNPISKSCRGRACGIGISNLWLFSQADVVVLDTVNVFCCSDLRCAIADSAAAWICSITKQFWLEIIINSLSSGKSAGWNLELFITRMR